MSKVLVLGANGFIGSHLVDKLAASGHSVRAFDRFGSREAIFNKNDNIELFAGNYLNTNDLEEALKGIDYVFHFISTTTPATADNDPTIDIDTNIHMSVELFKLCVRAGIKRILFASTGGTIYGLNKTSPHKETDLPLPVSPYAIGKLTIESYLRYFEVKHGLKSTSLRISNPYGERQPFHRKQGVIPIFLESIYRGKPVSVLGDGSMVRDYIYVRDLAEIISEIFEKDNLQAVYNIGSGVGTSINELIDIAKQVTKKDITVEQKPVPATFLHSVILDAQRFENDFGVKPLTDLYTGMAATYDYIKQEIDKVE